MIRNYKANIIKDGSNSICWLCEQKVNQLTSKSLIAQSYHQQNIEKKRPLYLLEKYGILQSEKLYKHQQEPTEAKEAANFWDFAIQTDRKIKSNRPDYKRKNMSSNWYISANT